MIDLAPTHATVARYSSEQQLYRPDRDFGQVRKDGNVGRIRLSGADAEARALMTRRIEATVQYMMRHLDRPMRVSVLCGLAGVSKSHFFAQFKTVTGLTPAGCFVHLRMRRAAEMLVTTPDRIKEVAARLGFEDPLHFSRQFKSVHGVAPRHFRDRAGGQSSISIQSRTTHNKTNNKQQ
jgi:transcriptional regulator GlxA family with amidase domain